MSTTKRGLAVSTLSPNQQLRSPKAISTSLAAARRAAPISMLPNDAVAQAAIATAEASAASALRTLFAYEERVDAAESAARVALEQRDKAELLRKAAEDERERYKSACEQICKEFSLFRNATRETMEAQATKAVISQGRHMRAIGALKFECDGLLRRVVSLSDERDSQNETTIMNIASSSTSLLETSSQFSELDRVSLEGYCSSLVQQVAALHRTLVDAEARSAVNAASMANSEEATRRVAAYESFLVAIGEEAVVDQVSNQGDGATQVLSNRNKASSSSSSASVFVTENNTMTSTSTPTLVSSPFIPVSTSQISSTSPRLIDVNFSPATSLHPTIEIERPSPSSFSSSIFVDNTAVTSNAASNAPLARTGNFQKTLNRAASAMAILSSPTGTTRNGFGGEVKKRNKNVRVSHVISLDDPLSSSSKASAQQTHSLSSSSSSSWSLIPDNSVEIIVKSLNDALVATSQLASMTMPISSPEKKSTLSMRTSTSNLLTAASAVAMVREALSRSFELAQYFETHLVAANGRATAAEDRISHLATTLEALRDTVTAHESLASRRAAELQMTVRLLESAEKDRDSVRSLNSKLADTLRRAEVSLKTLAIAHSKLKKGLKKSILNTADPIISALIEKDESELESITSGAIRTTELAVKSTDTDDIFLSQPVATQTIFLSSTPLPPSPPQQLQQQQQQNTNVQEPVNDVDNDSKIITNPPEPAFSLKSKDTTTPRDHANACSALSVESLASVAVEALLAASSAQVSISQPSFLTHSSPVSLTDTTLSKIVPTRVINLTMSPMDSTTLSTTPYLSSKTNQAQNLLYSPSFSQMQFRTTARPAPHSSTSGSSSVPPQLWSPGFAGTLFNVTNDKNLSTAPIVKTQSGDSNDDANDIALTAALSALLTAQQAQKSAQATLTAAGVLFQQPSPLLNAPFSGLKTQFASPVPLSLSPQPLTPSAFPPVDLLTFSTKSIKSRSSTVFQNTHIHVQETIDEEEKPVSPTSSRGDPDEVVWNVHSSGSVMASSPPERITVSPPPAPILTSQIQPSLSSPTRRSSMATFAMTVQRGGGGGGGGGTSVSNVSHYSTRYGRGNVNSESTAALKATIRARSQSSVTAFADASKSAVAVARVRGWSASAGALHAPPPATPLSKMKPTKSVPPETESKRLLNVLDKAESGSASEMFSSMISSDHMKKNIMSVTTTVPSSTTTSLLNGLLGVPTSNSFPPCSCVLSSINTSCSGCGSQLQGQKSQKSLLGFRLSTLSNGVGNHTLKSHKHCSHCLGPFCATCAGISHKLLAAPTRGGAGTLPRICNGCAGGLLLSGTVSNVDELKALRTALLSIPS